MPRKRRHFGLVALLWFLALAAAVSVVSLAASAERRKVRAAYEQLRQASEEKRFDEAYRMMTRDYRKRVSLDEFRKDIESSTMFAPDATTWIFFRRCDVWSESNWFTVGYVWTFKKEDGVWRCDGHGDNWFMD